ncbi:hypothetical protein IFM47457_01717 [Aspergillus lentulus]|nr:hypothetical protein IFM47457_01717 [Aspergillus lentulus]
MSSIGTLRVSTSAVPSATECTNTALWGSNLVSDFPTARSELHPTDFTSRSTSRTGQVVYDIHQRNSRLSTSVKCRT